MLDRLHVTQLGFREEVGSTRGALPGRRVLVAAVLCLALVAGGGVAAAFSATTGFSASTYASGFASAAGSTFIGTTLYAVDPVDGGLYRADTGTTPIAATRIATIGNAPTGIAALAGMLYVTQNTAASVVRIDPASPTIATPVAAIPSPAGIAVDPSSNDLFVAASDGVYRIRSPATAPTVSRYTTLLPGGPPVYGIAIGADDMIYASLPALGQVWQLQGPALVAAGQPLTPGPALYVPGARGVAIVAPYGYVSTADGKITRAALPGTGATTVDAVTGGPTGDLATIGTDGCYYASQGATVLRLGDGAGGCDLAHAGPQPPAPALTLVNTTPATTPPLIGGGEQTFTATLTNVASPGNLTVTFTVSGANSLTQTSMTGPNGIAQFAYSATNIGTDTIVASVVVGATTVTSNSLPLPWPRAKDTTPPTIAYAVTGTRAPNFGCPRSGIGTPGVTEYCGWYVTPPTITWTVTTTGASGIDTTLTSCPAYTLLGTSPLGGTPVTCIAYNKDGVSSSLQVVLEAIATPPTILASATAGGLPYVAGTPTVHDVTVSFACDSAYGQAGVTGCTAPITVTAPTASVSGSVIDVSDTVGTASFGPIVIDRTGPAITALATRSGGGAYVYGTWVNAPVTLTFSCTDASGVASCPAARVVSSTTPAVTVGATDTLGNASQASFGPVNIDLVAPSSTLTQRFGAITLAATDAASGVASITYSIDGAASTTVAGPSAAFTLGPGTHAIAFFATDVAGNVEVRRTSTIVVPARVPTTVSITSEFVASGGPVTATLTSDGAPVAGEPLVFTVGATTRTVTTGANGAASADLGLAPGTYALTVTYAGAEHFFPSSATRTIVAYAMTRFVVWSANVAIGATVQFYGDDWAKQIADRAQRKVLEEFKGYAQTTTPTSWTGRGGDAVKAPRTVPEYIGVALTSHAAKTRDSMSGDIVGIAIVRVTGGRGDRGHDRGTAKPYDGRIGDEGVGTVVGLTL